MEKVSQITVKMDPGPLREFRAECIRRGTTPTKELARLMGEQLAQWQQEVQQRVAHRHH